MKPLLGLLILLLGPVSFVTGQTLSDPQLATLKADFAANTTLVPTGLNVCKAYVGQAVNTLANAPDQNECIAALYNLNASPSFTVWKTFVSLGSIGKAMDGAEAAGLTTANNSRLQVRAAFMAEGESPSVAGTRVFYDDIFSTGGVTRAALLVLWKRLASRFEKLYATGTGTDVSPATLVIEAVVGATTINTARNLP